MSLRIVLFLTAWLFPLLRASADLAIGPAEWGFNGRVVGNAFNIVTIEVRNTGGQAFDGDLALDDSSEFGSRSAAPYVQRVFLAPGTTRRVQFYPYIPEYPGHWQLTWKENNRTAKESVSPKSDRGLQRGPPATVVLADLDSPGLRNMRMPVFNEASFPATAAATEGLHAVVLDHQPRWDPPRREALLDWVKRGGIVHLVRGPEGTHPHFTEELAPLNITGERAYVGAGLVVKHNLAQTEMTEAALIKAGFPAPEYREDGSGYDSDNDRAFFNPLSAVTKPKIAWWLIYLLTGVYVILIGPVFYIYRKRDYRVLLAAFLGTVALFAWIFTVVGRRGYGEKQIYHSLALARGLGDGRWDVQHWIHAFATSSGEYRFQHPGTSQLYAAPGEGGTVQGAVIHGRDGHFDADIPLFSPRNFLHRGVLAGPDFALKIVQFSVPKGSDHLGKLRIELGPQFPPTILKAAVQYGDQFSELTHKGNTLEFTNSSYSTSAGSALGTSQNQGYDYGYGSNLSAAQAAENLRSFGGMLARRVSGDPNARRHLTSRAPGKGQVRLFIYATAPESFRLRSDQFQAGTAYVLYVQDLLPSVTE